MDKFKKWQGKWIPQIQTRAIFEQRIQFLDKPPPGQLLFQAGPTNSTAQIEANFC